MQNNLSTIPSLPQQSNTSMLPNTDPILALVERAARDPSVDIDKMQRLLDMRKQMDGEQAERAFDNAMAEAQAEMEPIQKDLANPQTHSRYASLPAVDKALRPIYTKHKFAVTFDAEPTADPFRIIISARVTCGGHARIYRIPMPIVTKGPRGQDVMTETHALGSAVSYGRRYLLLMIFNLSTATEDDDGNRAGGRGAPPKEMAQPRQANPPQDPGPYGGGFLPPPAGMSVIEKRAPYDIPLTKKKDEEGNDTKNDDWPAWATTFVNHIKEATDQREIDKWTDLNNAKLNQCKAKKGAEKLYQRILTVTGIKDPPEPTSTKA